MREVAAQALGLLGQTTSIAALEARRRAETEGRVRHDIDAGQAQLRAER